jgi:hypothetical protein
LQFDFVDIRGELQGQLDKPDSLVVAEGPRRAWVRVGAAVCVGWRGGHDSVGVLPFFFLFLSFFLFIILPFFFSIFSLFVYLFYS